MVWFGEGFSYNSFPEKIYAAEQELSQGTAQLLFTKSLLSKLLCVSWLQ